MNEKIFNTLRVIIDDYINRNIRNDIARKRINGVLHNKSIDTVIKELNDYISDKSGNQKNKAVLIVVMALLCRNHDQPKDIKALIEKYNLTGSLFGGLYVLLLGDSENFSLKVKMYDERFNNKYEFVNSFFDYGHLNHILVLGAARILYLLDENKFEKLALSDKSNLILLNMVTYHLDIRPSDALITRLLTCDNELKQNIGLYFITNEVTRAVNDICAIIRCDSSGLPITGNIKAAQKSLNAEVDKCCSFLDSCDITTQATLLFNYILVHQNQYHSIFAYKLMSSNLQAEFVKQIKDSGKIRMLKDISSLIDLISNTPALDNKRMRISKSNLYMSIADLLVRFLEEKRIYVLEEQERKYMQNIFEHLPKKSLRRLRSYLLKKRKTLMCEEIDRLVRFNLYLEDKKTADIVDYLLTLTQSMLC